MSEAALGQLIDCQTTLIEALDGNDPAALEAAIADFARAVENVRAISAWHETPEIAQHLLHALQLADAARARVNYLADRNRRSIERLIGLAGGDPSASAYSRGGRLTP
ncbi:hypothetical protein CLG96_15690 [Sphingomonas oleivorans]|uniref:Flagellar protein FlgN n=1 Tax=Sphingomonas oleivorans TaxID=1735121 RepID=A0A2T5FUE7_9SPHN|nr:hypothetical protein [Sphingomonas oleivorans]PTQ08152.1 hypothetical protein CLG96_15690 [Sphingomonas oleivorans]